ncbi:MAG: cytochrome c [Fibrobacteria bacterium]|nr:cytochrome c [Fibrobacteria bacterium]
MKTKPGVCWKQLLARISDVWEARLDMSIRDRIISKLEMVGKEKPSFTPLIYKGTLVLIALAALFVPLMLVAIPYIPFFNDMSMQAKAKTQGTYGYHFDDEQPLLFSPVPGTLSRNADIPGDSISLEASAAMGNPVPVTMASLKKGREAYDIFCIVCHGKLGEGDGPVIGPNRFPAPPTLHSEAARAYKDGQFFHIITYGKNIMPSYADKLGETDRWHVVNYLHALRRAYQPQIGDFTK